VNHPGADHPSRCTDWGDVDRPKPRKEVGSLGAVVLGEPSGNPEVGTQG
jgi:hypothetical protein